MNERKAGGSGRDRTDDFFHAMELENMQVVDGTRPKKRLDLKKPGKWLRFDTKFDTNLGQGQIVVDQPSSRQTKSIEG